jgi:hypothetical protein
VRPVAHERTRPIVKIPLWMLTRNDRILGGEASGHPLGASGHGAQTAWECTSGRRAATLGPRSERPVMT